MYDADYLLRLGKRRVQVVRDSALLTGALYPHGHTHLAPRLPDRIDPGSPSPASTSSTTADRAPSGSSGVRPLVVVTLPKSHKDASTNPAAAGARAGAAGAGARPEQRPRGQLAVHLHAVAQLVNKHGFQVVLQAVDADSRDTHAEQLGALNAMIEAGAPPVVAHDEVRWRFCMECMCVIFHLYSVLDRLSCDARSLAQHTQHLLHTAALGPEPDPPLSCPSGMPVEGTAHTPYQPPQSQTPDPFPLSTMLPTPVFLASPSIFTSPTALFSLLAAHPTLSHKPCCCLSPQPCLSHATSPGLHHFITPHGKHHLTP